MKLLTPNNTKDLKSEDVREILRAQEVRKEADRLRKELAQAEADFNATLARNKEQWAIIAEEHEKDLATRKSEIDYLIAKKMNALIPVGVLNQATEGRLDEAMAYVSELQEREAYNEDLKDKLEDKLDWVGAKEQDLNKKEKELSFREQGVTRQAEHTQLQAKSLSEEMVKFVTKKDKAEKLIEEQKTALFLKERSLESKEQSLKRTEQALADLGTRLEDERGTLARAWEELKRLQKSP